MREGDTFLSFLSSWPASKDGEIVCADGIPQTSTGGAALVVRRIPTPRRCTAFRRQRRHVGACETPSGRPARRAETRDGQRVGSPEAPARRRRARRGAAACTDPARVSHGRHEAACHGTLRSALVMCAVRSALSASRRCMGCGGCAGTHEGGGHAVSVGGHYSAACQPFSLAPPGSRRRRRRGVPACSAPRRCEHLGATSARRTAARGPQRPQRFCCGRSRTAGGGLEPSLRGT